MKKKKAFLFLGIFLIILTTVALVLLLPSGKKDSEVDEKQDAGMNRTEAPGPASTTEQKSEQEPETQEAWRTALSEAEQRIESDTEAKTEKKTEKIVDGSGKHNGYLGSSYEIPEGFQDVSPAPSEDGYIYLYKNPERDMILQVTEYRLEKRNIGFEAEYSVYHNMYKNDSGTEITYDEMDGNRYCISGYTADGTRVFYLEGFKKPDRHEVQIYSEYPNDAGKEDCDRLLEVLQDTLDYTFVTDPESVTEEELR